MSVERNAHLAPFTSFRVGGSAAALVSTNSSASNLQSALAVCEEVAAASSRPMFVLGGGSNVLVADEGYDGPVLKLTADRELERNGARVWVSAATKWDALVEYCVENGLQGLELTSGIPGSVGGAIVQNASAYDSHLQAVEFRLESVRCLDLASGDLLRLSAADCEFAYRTSIFKGRRGSRSARVSPRLLILDAVFAMNQQDWCTIEEAALVERLRSPTRAATGLPMMEARRVTLDERKVRGHLQDPAGPFSAGSFFLNHPVDGDDPLVERTEAVFRERHSLLLDAGCDWVQGWTRVYSMKRGHLVAAFLIGTSCDIAADPNEFAPSTERDGLLTGSGANSLLHLGGATSERIVARAKRMKQAVEQTYGILLEPEVIMLGPKGFTI